jgi:hypothetical protein
MAMADAPKKKIVVLDVDETLGYFVELGIFCDSLTKTAWNNDATAQYAHFNLLMDLYPEFLRPNIIDLLRFLKTKKDSKECCGVMVYTNNNGPRMWVEHIIKYMESKLGARLFDQIVAAFKVNGQIIEMGRTTHDKTYEDLLRCTKLPSNVEVCFLDDQMHSQMEHGQVYYINVKSYVHQLSVQTLLDRFMQSSVLRATIGGHMSNDEVRQRIAKIMQRFQAAHVPKDPMEQEIDAIISKKIMEHLNTFFKGTTGNANTGLKGTMENANTGFKGTTGGNANTGGTGNLRIKHNSNNSNTLKMKHHNLKTKTVKKNKL